MVRNGLPGCFFFSLFVAPSLLRTPSTFFSILCPCGTSLLILNRPSSKYRQTGHNTRKKSRPSSPGRPIHRCSLTGIYYYWQCLDMPGDGCARFSGWSAGRFLHSPSVSVALSPLFSMPACTSIELGGGSKALGAGIVTGYKRLLFGPAWTEHRIGAGNGHCDDSCLDHTRVRCLMLLLLLLLLLLRRAAIT